MLKVTVLTDNNVPIGSSLLAEHGLCFYLETNDDLRILFDLGLSDVFIKNAYKLNIRIDNISHLVFSHSHHDHTDGLRYWIKHFGDHIINKPKLIAHEFAFYKKTNVKHENVLYSTALDNYFDVEKTTTVPININDDLIFLGQIERNNDFEGKTKFGNVVLGSEKVIDDYCVDDSALLYRSTNGIVIITGCSHSGICNIIQYAQKIAQKEWNMDNIICIIGGFHLINPSESILDNTVLFLQAKNINSLHTCHCTDLHSKIFFAKAGLPIMNTGVGTTLEFE